MKLQVMSDIHLEFRPGGVYTWQIPETDADAIVLAGDVGMWKPATQWAVRESRRLGKPIIYVPGNHEWYRDSMKHVARAREIAACAEAGVHVLDCAEVVIGDKRAGGGSVAGVRFLGATLWTDYALFGEDQVTQAAAVAENQMNDFRLITFQSQPFTRFTPGIARRLHLEARCWLEERLAQPAGRSEAEARASARRLSADKINPTVVVTHHAPSNLGQSERFRQGALAPSFASDLSALMDPAKVALWIHGHTHYCSRYEVAGVPVATNQAGYYQIEEVPGFDPALVVEV